MSDETKDAKDIADLSAQVSTTAPALQTSELWGGPRWIENATSEPVYVTTKEEYWALLNARGLRMKHQQESSTGPAQNIIDEVNAALPKPRIVPRLTQEEAHIYGAIFAVKRRLGIKETLWCKECFRRNTHHGVRLLLRTDLVRVMCRCGIADYQPPTGTTDLVLRTLPNIAHVETDKT